MLDFDIVVIGTGMAGQPAASWCAKAGKRVAIVDALPYGGTCMLRGCDPKRVMVEAAYVVDRAAPLLGQGIDRVPHIDWRALQARKRSFTDPVPQSIEESFKRIGIEMLHGEAHIVGDGGLEVDGKRLWAENVVIATGARPRDLAFPGADLLTTSTQFLDLYELPKRIAFVGGGYIAFEFAGLAARSGAKVSILHAGDHALEGFDPDLADMLVENYRGIGVDVVLNARVGSVQKAHDGLEVTSEAGTFEADLVVHAAGRVPDVERLRLDDADVRYGPHGVEVDETMRSITNPRFFAAGDAASIGLPLTPVASRQGAIAARNILGESVAFDGTVTPSVVFAEPPLASVGLREADIGPGAGGVEVVFNDTRDWFTSRRLAQAHSGSKVLVDKRSGLILGAHVLGACAEELINLFALTMRHGIDRDGLRELLTDYPTVSSDLQYMV